MAYAAQLIDLLVVRGHLTPPPTDVEHDLARSATPIEDIRVRNRQHDPQAEPLLQPPPAPAPGIDILPAL
jgi:hypothetical protein